MAEKPYKIKPTLVDIGCRVTAAAAFAEIYIETHPQHEESLHHFVEEITKSFRELREVVYGKPVTD